MAAEPVWFLVGVAVGVAGVCAAIVVFCLLRARILGHGDAEGEGPVLAGHASPESNVDLEPRRCAAAVAVAVALATQDHQSAGPVAVVGHTQLNWWNERRGSSLSQRKGAVL